MTIRKGEQWGDIVDPPAHLPLLATDTAVHDWIVRHRRLDEPVTPFGVAGGDLSRTAGGGAADRFAGVVARVPLDLVRVEANGRTTWSAAHVVARRSRMSGPLLFAMTAQFFDGRDLAPRSHPNDGKVDVLRVDAAMPRRDRVAAWRRARTGTHLPHPQLSIAQVVELDETFERNMVVWVDGERFEATKRLRLVVEPDAYVAYI